MKLDKEVDTQFQIFFPTSQKSPVLIHELDTISLFAKRLWNEVLRLFHHGPQTVTICVSWENTAARCQNCRYDWRKEHVDTGTAASPARPASSKTREASCTTAASRLFLHPLVLEINLEGIFETRQKAKTKGMRLSCLYTYTVHPPACEGTPVPT